MSFLRIKTLAVCFLILAISNITEIKSEPNPTITTQELMQKVKEKYDSHSSVSYNVNFIQKSVSGDDTSSFDADVMLSRDKSDSVFGGHLYFITGGFYPEDGIYARYYDLKKLYILDDSQKEITEYNAHRGETGIIRGNVAGYAIEINFLKTDKLLKYVTENVKNFELNFVDGFYHLRINKHNTEYVTEFFYNFIINAETFVIENFNNSVKVNDYDEYQYTEWDLTNIVFDNVSLSDFENLLESKKEEYDYKIYYPRDESYYAALPEGSIAPNFTGKIFSDNSEFSLEKYKGKVVVLDFFYMSCFPCIKAIPHISKIHNEYHDVVVLGINSKDNNEKDLKQLPKFIEKQKFDYPIILTDDETDNLFNVKGYPTLYVIDKDGKIAYSHIGSSEELYDKLKEVIDKIQ